MKISIIFLMVAVACLIAVSNAQRGKGPKKCDRICTQQIQPVCATRDRGKTHRRFNNSCLLAVENCKTKNAWKKVDLNKCKK
ncbi:vasotab-like [Eupeodes corollae]|uniref:vasotab-like n=1 Tax=Eupeodes corollae TaxID=290404 RepID=UPI0024922B74|nr:vasotab-like [Eupeodes corollae]